MVGAGVQVPRRTTKPHPVEHTYRRHVHKTEWRLDMIRLVQWSRLGALFVGTVLLGLGTWSCMRVEPFNAVEEVEVQVRYWTLC